MSRFASLVLKEFRQLLPIGWLWVVIAVIGYALLLINERLDERTFGDWCDGVCTPGSNEIMAAIVTLYGLVTAWALFPREHDEGTIDFLRALPVSRVTIFIAKVSAAWLLLTIISLAVLWLDRWMLSLNHQSIDGVFYSQVWTAVMLRDIVFTTVVLSHGVFVSRFRVLGLFLYLGYLIALIWWTRSTGNVGPFSVFSLYNNEYYGSTLILDREAIFTQLGIAAVLLTLACLLWSRESSANEREGAARGGSRWLTFIAWGFGFVVVVGSTLAWINYRNGLVGGELSELQVVSTEHYRFTYDIDRQNTAEYVIEHADADLAELGKRLGVAELPRIRVDLSAESEHAAGLATWKTISMDIDKFDGDYVQRRVLVHEAAHVLQATLSDRKLAAHAASARFFIEGMANTISFDIIPQPERQRLNDEVAAVAWKRHAIRFEDLVDDAGFVARFDNDLHYSLGEVWTRALMTVCGDAVLGDILRAMGREDAPRNIAGEAFWRDVMGEVGCELDAVNRVWAGTLERIWEGMDRSAYPVFTDIAIEAGDGSDVIVLARLEDESGRPASELPLRFSLRLEGETSLAQGLPSSWRGVAEEDANGDPIVRFRVPARALSGQRFRYQIGYLVDEGGRFWFDRWREGSRPASFSDSF